MATIPLHQTPAHLDAWRMVGSPGGYEWWYFDAEDPERDLQLVAILFQGFIFHPGYLRAYGRYHRAPTRFAPPLPREFPCAYFVVYEGGAVRHQFMTQYSPEDFVASAGQPRVQVGPNSLEPVNAGLRLGLKGTPWVLTWKGPTLLSGQTLAAELSFAPRLSHAPVERTFLSRELSGADHRWIIANPLCDVRGKIDCNGQAIDFNGRGYHDHNYGTAPIGQGLHRWLWGRVIFDDAVYTFHFARAADRSLPDEIHLVQADATGIKEIPVAVVEGNWSQRNAWRLAYPTSLKFENALGLSNARVIDSSPFYLRLTYDAACADRHGRAFCEIAYPHRLRWPVLGRMIGMSIDKGPCHRPAV